jgi:hypothetical protein
MRKSDLELKIANLEELVRILSARIRKNEDAMTEDFNRLFKMVGDGCSAVNSGVERTVSLTDVVMEVLDTMKLDLCYVTPPKKHVMLVPKSSTRKE